MAAVSRRDDYVTALRTLDDWEPYLRRNSGLPGPRANLELVQAAADAGTLDKFERWAAADDEYLALCAAVGFGRLVAEGRTRLMPKLRKLASDRSWRAREGVAMGLQRVEEADMQRLLTEMGKCAKGNLLEQRAAAAALCEPRLLRAPRDALRTLELLDAITTGLSESKARESDDFKILRQGLGYCWSVAAAALAEKGREAFDKWTRAPDPDVRWVMRQNFGKSRMKMLGEDWVARKLAQLA